MSPSLKEVLMGPLTDEKKVEHFRTVFVERFGSGPW